MPNNEERTIEDAFRELEEIVRRLESGEMSLEESFAGYEQGMRLLKETGEKIDMVEKKMKVLEGNEDAEENQ